MCDLKSCVGGVNTSRFGYRDIAVVRKIDVLSWDVITRNWVVESGNEFG